LDGQELSDSLNRGPVKFHAGCLIAAGVPGECWRAGPGPPSVLEDLVRFETHGRPLVLKSDNGSAFRAEATTEWLLADSVVQLFSPAGYPQYNGQLERSNAVNKTYTHQRAAAEGHPHRWTEEDLEYARTLTNTISRPWGHEGPTPDEAWQARAAVTDEERAEFAAEVAGQHARLVTERAQATAPTAEEADDLQRRAVAGALEACGYLTREEVRRAPRTRQQRDSLERRLRQFREQGAKTIEQPTETIKQPADTIKQPADTTGQPGRDDRASGRRPCQTERCC
jgi:hypothetical protein